MADARSRSNRDGSPSSHRRQQGRARGAQRLATRRRRAAAALALLALISFFVGLTVGGSDGSAGGRSGKPSSLAVVAGGRTLVRTAVRARHARASEERVRLPETVTAKRGAASITYRIDRAAAARRAKRAPTSRDSVIGVPRTPVQSDISAPVVAQKLHNNCEAAALESLLATVGHREDQLRLQRALSPSSPLDPRGTGAARVWGDPDRGFVGRADGSGPAGGFGVYPGPVAQLAARRGVTLKPLTGASSSQVYATLLSGHAVMAWVGLGAGPYASWRSTAGRSIDVNLNEHTVVLTGIRADGMLRVMNPLTGTRELWSQQSFESMWSRLGHRALST